MFQPLAVAMQDNTSGEIIGGQPNSHAVSCLHTHVITAQLPAQFAVNLDLIIEFNTIEIVGIRLSHIAIKFNQTLR
jgi:hypothetical protein